ncbi:MAG: GntR family transcriptional regulator [Actinomycetaceae bacterium]|nr:GntR family transcriptional regulator [Actinomycetaceae bacterium]
METPFQLNVTIERHSSTPLYQQIAEPLEQAIIAGEVAPGELVEDEISMAKRLQVSRPTARRALQELVNRGLLTRRRGVGTRVTPSQIHRPLELSSLNDDLIKAGFTPTTRVLSYEIIEAGPLEAKLLNLSEGDGVLLTTRLRSIDGQPLAILTNHLPLELAPEWAELQRDGLYDCFANRGIKIASATQVIGARSATSREAELLDEDSRAPLLTMERTAYTEDGKIVEVGNHVYRPTLYSFRFTVFAN